jgi:hypothetical protein
MKPVIKLQLDVLPAINSAAGANGQEEELSISPLMREPKANLA